MKVKPRTIQEVLKLEFLKQDCDHKRFMFDLSRRRLAEALPELSEQDVSDIANGVVLFDVNSVEVLEGDKER